MCVGGWSMVSGDCELDTLEVDVARFEDCSRMRWKVGGHQALPDIVVFLGTRLGGQPTTASICCRGTRPLEIPCTELTVCAGKKFFVNSKPWRSKDVC